MALITTRVEGALRVHRVWGPLTCADVMNRMRNQAHAPARRALHLWDLSAAELVGWDFDAALQLAEWLRLVFPERMRAALVAPSADTYGTARIVFATVQSRIPLAGGVFRCEAEARAWLACLDDQPRMSRTGTAP